MAYSDYGGYAYRDGVRVVERSDCLITPDGDTYATPGMWPGFVGMFGGKPSTAVANSPKGHAVLGDGPIRLLLYKQSAISVYQGAKALSILDLCPSVAVDSWTDKDGLTSYWVDVDHYRDNGIPLVIEAEGVQITVWFTYEDNYYMYARLVQPDGHVWHGWSGYGVGAGLESGSHGYSTLERESQLCEFWPDAIVRAGEGLWSEDK